MRRNGGGCGRIVGLIGLLASCIGIFAFATGFQSLQQIPFIAGVLVTETLTPTKTLMPTDTPTPSPTSPPTKTPNPPLLGKITGTLTANVCTKASADIGNKIIITVGSISSFTPDVNLGVSSNGRPMIVYADVELGESIVYRLDDVHSYEVRVMSFYESLIPSGSCVTLRVNEYTQ